MMVEVRALPEQGFFRAGMFFPSTPTTVDVDEETFQRLEAEPRLSVKPVGEEDGLSLVAGHALADDFPGRKALVAAGLTTMEAVAELSRDQLIALKGIGEGTADQILTAVEGE